MTAMSRRPTTTAPPPDDKRLRRRDAIEPELVRLAGHQPRSQPTTPGGD